MRLIIVGGVAGGATAAARARRLSEDAEIVLFEKGHYVSYANCGLPYYMGGEIKRRDDLFVASPDLLRKRYRVDVRTSQEVTEIDRARKWVRVRDLATGEEFSEGYDKLILSPGSTPVRPPLPGIDSERVFTLKDMPDIDSIKRYLDTKQGRIGSHCRRWCNRSGVGRESPTPGHRCDHNRKTATGNALPGLRNGCNHA